MQIGSNQWCSLLRKGALIFGVDLKDQGLNQFTRFAQELLTWNTRTNLTSIVKPEEILEKHFIDCLAMASYIEPDAMVLDIGSGAGFPGIPLKIALPDLNLTLIDASAKRISFLKYISRILGVEDIRIQHVRAENLAQMKKEHLKFDVVISRAFSALDQFLTHALPLLSNQGMVLAMKGRFPTDEIEKLGGIAVNSQVVSWSGYCLKMDVIPYQLPFSCGSRSLVSVRLK